MKRIIFMALCMIWKVPYYLIGIKRRKNFKKYNVEQRYAFLRKFVFAMIKASNVEIIADGMENLPEKDGYLIAPNHQGMYDPFLVVYTHERPITCVCKKELEKAPVVRDVIDMVPAVTIDRSNLRESVKAIRAVSKEIGEGRNYLIFPEGTRSKQGNTLGEFKGGTIKAATDQKAPIVPVALVNDFLPMDSNSIKKVTVQIHYLKPLYYDDYKDLTSIEIATKIHDMIQERVNEEVAKLEK